jgi:hypothetical protein
MVFRFRFGESPSDPDDRGLIKNRTGASRAPRKSRVQLRGCVGIFPTVGPDLACRVPRQASDILEPEQFRYWREDTLDVVGEKPPSSSHRRSSRRRPRMLKT